MSDDKKKKRVDKIFNNSYKTGENLTNSVDYEFGTSISVDKHYSDSYLSDIYDYENSIEYKILLKVIMDIINNNDRLKSVIDDKKGSRGVFNKDDINFLFDGIMDESLHSSDDFKFFNPIYAFEIISNITAMSYKKIFDYLNYEHKEAILLELDKTHNVFNFNNKKDDDSDKRLF